jgi:hypothetical protein
MRMYFVQFTYLSPKPQNPIYIELKIVNRKE